MMKVGLIKGGQLGLMMLQEKAGLDIFVSVMDDDPACPCRDLADEFVLGDSMREADVYAFGKYLDVLTFEYEHINIRALERLKAEGVKIRPDPTILKVVQDKGTQKEFYRGHGIPTAAFRLTATKKDLLSCGMPPPFVVKTRKAGYDGKGVYKVTAGHEQEGAFDGPCVIEEHIDFAKEIAVEVARGPSGGCAVYPTVEMVFHPVKNLVEFLACPADLTPAVDGEAKRIALRLANELDVIGVLAVEMFVTKDGMVLVNEIAPRVHNSGHHTIEAAATSQFRQHWQAVLGLSLGSVDLKSPAVMVNILGADGFSGPARYEGIEQAKALGGVYVHLYGKAITKPFRKMGHATVLDGNIDRAMEKARLVKEIIKVKA